MDMKSPVHMQSISIPLRPWGDFYEYTTWPRTAPSSEHTLHAAASSLTSDTAIIEPICQCTLRMSSYANFVSWSGGKVTHIENLNIYTEIFIQAKI
jgi:hypothetical protein